ncbi:phage tail protein [Allorhizobium taibaishanense]|uniref:Phage tail protein n=1 Tax=Allorhizobium taibaishanense TaxID=887144 RepID=A0A1Q9A2P3_9HYPH|nr:phage tail protein [Allorhizobium taibaishanense]MBB4005802.1 hypothetical protein [Allorhizobium taibaishanense]OLP48851.1 hypothetical protein BJF91_17095 [Allorhizobium taibaishanense]
MTAVLVPSNSTVLEEALAVATDPFDAALADLEAVRGFRYQRPLNATVAPYLVQEYGLGPIADFFDTAEDLIDSGRAWQAIRGTPKAILDALRWIAYYGPQIEDQVKGRRRWHLYQIAMGELPGDDEVQRLYNAWYLADLSDPVRSEFFRGYFAYDVRGLSWSRRKWGSALWGDSSGARIDGNPVKWSHGRSHAIAIEETFYEWERFGWNDTLSAFGDGGWPAIAWSQVTIPWSAAGSPTTMKAWLLLQEVAHLVFYTAAGAVIGYSRIIMAAENQTEEGDDYVTVVYKARTRFGNGAGQTSAKIGIVYGLELVDGVKPYKSWLEPSEVITGSGIEVGKTNFALRFFETVRELFTVTLTINPIQIVPVHYANPALSLG